MFKENFKDVKENTGEFAEVSDGIKRVLVEKAQEKTSSAGNNMVQLTLRITEGEDKNKVIFPAPNIVFTEKMRGRNKHILKVLNQPYEGEPIIEAENWINQECYIRIRVKYDKFWKREVPNVTQWLTDEQLEEEMLKQTGKSKEPGKEAKETKEKEEQPPLQKDAPVEEKGKGEDEIPF